MKELICSQAIAEAIYEEMERDSRIIALGQDIRLRGGSFGTLKGLYEAFGPERVIDTPISETAMIGAAVGAAATGLRPVVELNFMDFTAVAFDQVINQAAKIRYMFGGNISVPLVILGSTGGGFSAAAQHSQSLESIFAHIPGLKVVLPSRPADFKGLMKSAIRDNNPVMFMGDKVLLNKEKGPVPDGEHLVPLGKATVLREGTDLTVVVWGKMVNVALHSADRLEEKGISCEVIDPRTIQPFDIDAVVGSVQKTGRCLVLHEAVRSGGFGAEVAAQVGELAFDYLDAPVMRIGAPSTPVPFSPVLERFFIPSEDRVVEQVLAAF